MLVRLVTSADKDSTPCRALAIVEVTTTTKGDSKMEDSSERIGFDLFKLICVNAMASEEKSLELYAKCVAAVKTAKAKPTER